MPLSTGRQPARIGLRTTGMMVGFLLAMVGPITLFGQRKHSRDFLFESAGAFPWATALSLIGALLILWSCWRLPREATGGPALAIILLLLTAAGIIVGLIRLDSPLGPELIMSLAGQALTILALGLSMVQSARKPQALLR